jgi:hypothetical protein
MLIALTSLAFEIAAQRARCLILKTEHELSVVGDASAQIGVAYFLIGRWEPSSDLSFFTTSRSTPHPLRVLAGLSPRQPFVNTEIFNQVLADGTQHFEVGENKQVVLTQGSSCMAYR